MKSRRCGLLVAVAMCVSKVLAHAGPPFLMLPDTLSPDGRYGFAWGMPEKYPIDWDKLRLGKEPSETDYDNFSVDAENYLVDARAGKILTRLETAQMWLVPDRMRANRRELKVCWSPKSDIAIALFAQRWDYGSFEAFRVGAGKSGPALDIGKPLEKALRQYLAKEFGKRYEARKDSLSINFGLLLAEPDGKFSARVDAYVAKSDNEDDSFQHRIRFSLVPLDGLRLGLKVGAIAPEDHFDDPLDERLAAADRELNAAYQELRKALPAKAREELRREQVAWLKKRDAEEVPGDRAAMIEARSQELRQRKQAVNR